MSMNIKEQTIDRIEDKLNTLEETIHDKGIGSSYLNKAQNIQRDVNLGILLGGAAVVLGVGSWLLIKKD